MGGEYSKRVRDGICMNIIGGVQLGELNEDAKKIIQNLSWRKKIGRCGCVGHFGSREVSALGSCDHGSGDPSSMKGGSFPDHLSASASWSQLVVPISELVIWITESGGNSRRSNIALFHLLTNMSTYGMLVSGQKFYTRASKYKPK